jgi:hypothetical protein
MFGVDIRGQSGPDAVVVQMNQPVHTLKLVLSKLSIDNEAGLLLEPLMLEVV